MTTEPTVSGSMRARVHEASDEQIVRSALHALDEDPCVALDARAIAVDYVGGRIVLRGWTRTRREREEAERLASAMPGVSLAENRLQVTRAAAS